MPSLNTGNAILSNAIAVNSSYNVGIGGAASGSYKLQVTGTIAGSGLFSNPADPIAGLVHLKQGSQFEGATGFSAIGATASNQFFFKHGISTNSFFLSSASITTERTYTLPDASGTLALTSNLSAYLPLTGGTLTGALSGTSATFSSDVTVNGILNNRGSADNVTEQYYYRDGTYEFGVQKVSGRGTDLFFTGPDTNFNIAQRTTYGTLGGTVRFTVASGGNVGIGTSSPGAGLEVVTDSGVFNALRVVSNRAQSSGTDVAIAFRYLSDSTNYVNGGLIVVGKDNTTSGNQLGNMQFYTNGGSGIVERMRITSGGNVLIGTTTDNGAKLQVSSSVAVGDSVGLLGELYWGGFSSGQKVRAYPTGSSGSATLNFSFWNGSAWVIQGTLTSAGVWNTTGGGTSDARTKDEIDYNFDNGIESILKLQPTKFKFKISPNKQRRGFIAQDVLEVIPDLVLGDGEKENGTYGLDYDGILAIAVKAIQELKAEIDDQQQTINSLINR
jgi:hypothetical protein